MTIHDRITAATQNSLVVVAADGLLAHFNDAGVLDPLDVQAARSIGRLLGETDDRALLVAALTVRGARFGHVCVRLDSIRDTVVVDGQDPREIESLPWPDAATWETAVASGPLVGDGAGDEPLVFQDGRLYLERYFRYETLVAALITERCGAPPRELAARTYEMLTRLFEPHGGGPVRQYEAAVLALTSRIAVIAGGPGTGKTHTVATLLAALAAGEDEFPKVAVCAPTGKAAARLGQALIERADSLGDAHIAERLATVEPSTIHRLLGWSWDRGRFAHHSNNRLPHDLVVVDEMSMVSLPMAAKLLAAIDDNAGVVLVGDPFQLEAIEAGTVLADIVGPAVPFEPEKAPPAPPIEDHVVVLERTYRFEEDSAIADFAEAIRTGDADTAIGMLRTEHESLRWAEDRTHTEFHRLWNALTEQRSRMVTLASEGNAERAFQALSEMAVLCARRTGRDGVTGWSRDLETALDEQYTGLRWGGEWYAGRPVMITRNDYALDLYNGDIGICIVADDGLQVVFERDGLNAFPPSRLAEQTTVHAMTIHKSQGSQFNEVAIVLPEESSKLLTRQLLYTAVTRAKHRVHIVGSEHVVRSAIARSVQRASGLGVRLWGP